VYYEITKLLKMGVTDLTDLRNCKKVLSRENLYRQRARLYSRLKDSYHRFLRASLRETPVIRRMWPLIWRPLATWLQNDGRISALRYSQRIFLDVSLPDIPQNWSYTNLTAQLFLSHVLFVRSTNTTSAMHCQ
jgi:hypothetical protein